MEAIREKNIWLDIAKKEYQTVSLKQLDSTKLIFLIMENGVIRNCSDNSFVLNFRKGDNTIVIQTESFNTSLAVDGKISVMLDEDCVRAPGEGAIELQIYKGGKKVSSFSLDCNIDASIIHNAIPSQNKVTLIETLENKIQEGIITRDELNAWVEEHQDIVELDNRVAELDSQLGEIVTDKKSIQAYPPTICWIDDDARTVGLDKIIPIMKNLGQICSIAAVTDWIGDSTHYSLAQLKQLQNEGFEIVSHGSGHRDIDENTSLASITDELKRSHEYLKSNGLSGNNVMVWGNGNSTVLARQEAKRYYDVAFKWAGDGVYTDTIPTFRLGRHFLTSDNLDAVKLQVDNVANGGLLIIGTHSALSEFSEANTIELINYITSKGMNISTVNEALKLYRNLLEAGDRQTDFFEVGHNGKVKMSQLDFPVGMPFETPVGTPDNRVTIDTNWGSATVPTTEKKGTVITVSGNAESWKTQLWRANDSEDLYMRIPNDYRGLSWKAWMLINNLKFGYSSPTILERGRMYVDEKWSYTEAPTTQKNGTIISFASVADNRWDFRIWKAQNERTLYISIYDGTAWGSWVPISNQLIGGYNCSHIPSAFKAETTNVSRHDQWNATGAPLSNTKGILTTYSLSIYEYWYQEWKPVGSNQKYMRSSNSDGTAWGTWEKISAT